MRRIEDHQPIDELPMPHREMPCDRTAPVVTDDVCAALPRMVDERRNVIGERVDRVRG